MVVAALVAEVLLRAVGWATGVSRTLTADAELGWRMLPGVSKWGDGWSAARAGTTNSRGFRDAEWSEPGADGRRRVLALGDSCVFGFGVDQGERFTELLECERVDVLNTGVCAWGTDQQLLLFESDGRALRPDVVVWVICMYNDLDDIRSDRKAGWPKPWFALARDTLQLQPPRSDWWLAWRSHSYLGELVMRGLEGGQQKQTFAPAWREADAMPLFAALARRLGAGVAKAGAQLLAVIEPIGTEAPAPADARAVAVHEALAGAGIATLDLLPAFTAERAQWTGLRLSCGHWSAAGHRVVADAVRAELQRRSWW